MRSFLVFIILTVTSNVTADVILTPGQFIRIGDQSVACIDTNNSTATFLCNCYSPARWGIPVLLGKATFSGTESMSLSTRKMLGLEACKLKFDITDRADCQ